MDKEVIIRYLFAVGYTPEQIKDILGQPSLRAAIEKHIIELELKCYSSSNKQDVDEASRKIFEKMIELEANPEEYRRQLH